MLLAVLCVLFRRDIAGWFSRDEELVERFADIIPTLAAYGALQGLALPLTGTLIGVGRQKEGAVFVFLSFFVIGLPSSWYYGFHLGLGVQGLALGRFIAKCSQLLAYAYLAVVKLDFREEVRRADATVRRARDADAGRDADGAPTTKRPLKIASPPPAPPSYGSLGGLPIDLKRKFIV